MKTAVICSGFDITSSHIPNGYTLTNIQWIKRLSNPLYIFNHCSSLHSLPSPTLEVDGWWSTDLAHTSQVVDLCTP